MSSNKSIIVKKIKKIEGGHHGGAWKVAYADFVTAMMAFFLLLWLLSMVSDEKRARLSEYFKHFSMFDSGGESWMAKSSEMFDERGVTKQKAFADSIRNDVPNVEGIEEILKQGIAEHLGDVRDQVLVDVVEDGMRIQITDKDGSLMFQKGKKALTPKAKEVLKVISEQIRGLPNKLVIEGHTDALQYSGSDYSNWELSTERASSARKALEGFGIDPKRVIRVAGYADTDPLIKKDPRDPRNRRISITVKHAKKTMPAGTFAPDDAPSLKKTPAKENIKSSGKSKTVEESGSSLSENFKYRGLPLKYIENEKGQDDLPIDDRNSKREGGKKFTPAISNDHIPLLKDDLNLDHPAREGSLQNNRSSTNIIPRNAPEKRGASVSGMHDQKNIVKETDRSDTSNTEGVKEKTSIRKQGEVSTKEDASLSDNLDYTPQDPAKKPMPKEGGVALGEEWNPVISKDDFFSPPSK